MRGVRNWRKRFIWIVFCVVLLTLFGSGPGVAAEKQLKAGFVYVGPIGDYGWSMPMMWEENMPKSSFPG